MAPSLGGSGECRDAASRSLQTGSRCQEAPPLRGCRLLRVRPQDSQCCSLQPVASSTESPGCKAVRYSRHHRLLGAGESLPPCLGPCGRHSSPLLSLSVETACVSSHLPAKAIETWSLHQVPTPLQRRDSGFPSSLEPPFHSSGPWSRPCCGLSLVISEMPST